jgi:hypothetical protein
VNDSALHFPQTFNNSGIMPITFPSPGIQFNTNLEQNSFVLTNWGDALCYPNWVITGPGTPTVKNISVTPNRSWGLTQAIPAGQQVQVVTDKKHPSCKNVTTSANIWGQLSPNDLFPLFPGDNKVTITIPGATAATVVDVGFTNRWLRA